QRLRPDCTDRVRLSVEQTAFMPSRPTRHPTRRTVDISPRHLPRTGASLISTLSTATMQPRDARRTMNAREPTSCPPLLSPSSHSRPFLRRTAGYLATQGYSHRCAENPRDPFHTCPDECHDPNWARRHN